MTRRTVAVAMSGGVDSSVAAALCVEAGHNVVGIMLRLWSEPGAEGANRCCTLDAVEDARAVADTLNIPFSVIDVADFFRATVVDAFLADAAAGDTPNPCFVCNRRVRFGHLLAQAEALGADALATGHYARLETDAAGTHWLRRGADRAKDQSYVLHRLNQRQLAHASFPVGGYVKAEVRALAAGFGLPVASRADSVDLCWIGPGGVGGFLERHLPPDAQSAGPILDQAGRRLGEHHGLARYTYGQRKGLGVATGAPLFVVDKDAARNALILGPAEALLARRLVLRDMHWISGRAPAGPLNALAQIRYRAAEAPARVVPGTDAHGQPTAEVVFDAPQRAPTPGQGVVVYDGDRVLGGGLIAAVGAGAFQGGGAPAQARLEDVLGNGQGGD
jgi:tRNA-specific 2-thiouridylase